MNLVGGCLNPTKPKQRQFEKSGFYVLWSEQTWGAGHEQIWAYRIN
jgi:hypothetical protein